MKTGTQDAASFYSLERHRQYPLTNRSGHRKSRITLAHKIEKKAPAELPHLADLAAKCPILFDCARFRKSQSNLTSDSTSTGSPVAIERFAAIPVKIDVA